jgi:hypothetical protein
MSTDPVGWHEAQPHISTAANPYHITLAETRFLIVSPFQVDDRPSISTTLGASLHRGRAPVKEMDVPRLAVVLRVEYHEWGK